MTAPKVRLTVAIAPAVVEAVKVEVRRERARSVSAYVEHALAAQLAAEADFDRMMERALDETGGRPSRAERVRARKILDGPP